jgi:hypothetical protein
MSKLFLHAGKYLFIAALCVSFYAIIGCLESSFVLSNESRLPRWLALPSGLTRADVSVTMNYYSTLGGDDTKVILKDRSGKTLTEISGKERCQYPKSGYPAYDLIEANGIAEIIERKKMEPVFYINDDPSVRQKLLACGL